MTEQEPDPAPASPPPADAPPAPVHRRRPRYRGTHPRRFDEKYKELDPERFPGEAEKAAERGSTPAGTHIPVMLDEVLAALAPQPGDVALDATLGWGGHAEAVASRIGSGSRLRDIHEPREDVPALLPRSLDAARPSIAGFARGAGTLLGIDRDADELARTAERLARRGLAIRTHHGSYSGAATALRQAGLDGADVVLADLGCSSMQLDRPERGFSFKTDGPLDMRMDRTRPGTAAEWLAKVSVEDLEAALHDLGDEPDAGAVAREIVRRRLSGPPVATTAALVAAVLAAKHIPGTRFRREDAFTAHPAARTFQAVRIAVNREFEHLAQFLRDLPWIVRPGGRVVVLTFHSGEEQRVRASLEQGAAAGLWLSPLAAPAAPTPDERRHNPRARSARLHVAVRAAEG